MEETLSMMRLDAAEGVGGWGNNVQGGSELGGGVRVHFRCGYETQPKLRN